MTAPFGISNGPACELGRFIVQVIGKHHPGEQNVVLRSANEQSVWGSPTALDRSDCSSVLHVWDELLPGDRLCLEIACTDGEPIRLPLLDTPCWTPRQREAQYNQLVPVLPFVALPGSVKADDLGTPVLARAGYLYVFYQDRLWRELEIRIDDQTTTYYDVNLARYRLADRFTQDERKATGAALQDIWLPVRWNNQAVMGLQLCYSEIQLNAARLQRLEQDRELRAQRCQQLHDSTCSDEQFKGFYARQLDGLAMLETFSTLKGNDKSQYEVLNRATVARRNLELRCFPVSLVAPQRARQPGFEWQLEHPGRYLCDLSGAFPEDVRRQALGFLGACATGPLGQPADPLLELTPIADTLQAMLPAADDKDAAGKATSQEDADLWQAQPAVQDVLAPARQRQLCGVLLEDPRYRLRHLKMRLNTHHQLLHLCAAHAVREPHHGSALLLHQLVVPRTLQGRPNPLPDSLKVLDTQGLHAINQHLYVPQRALVWQRMSQAQHRLTACLQQARTQQALADHLSLDGFDYAAALLDVAQTLATLAAGPSRLDPLAIDGEMTDAVTGTSHHLATPTASQKWLDTLASDSDLFLHRMLWPESDMERVCQPYQPPENPGPNLGDGLWRSHELANLENTTVPAPEALTTLDATIVDGLLAGGSLDSFLIASGKNISNALMNIYDTLQGAVNTAAAAIENERGAVARAASEANASQAGKARADERLQKTRITLGSQARPVTITLHAQGVQQLRSLLPGLYGQAYFMRRGQVPQNYYLFGLEDLPTRQQTPRRFYGEFVNQNGQLLGSTDRNRLPQADLRTANHLVLAIPRNHSTAQRISHMNRQLIAAQQSAVDLSASESRLGQAQSALSEALQRHARVDNSAVYRLLKSSPFSVGVLMLEMWNVSVEMESREKNNREKNVFRTSAGVISAYFDLIIAMEALTVKLVGMQSENSPFMAARRKLFEVSRGGVRRWLGDGLARRFTTIITTRLLFQSLSALLFAGISFYDAWQAWQSNDDAMYGYLLMGTGALVGFTAGLVHFTPVLGLNPLGWVTLLVTGTGIALVLLLSDTPLEKWLATGPFGPDKDAGAAHLQDPQEAFYRLVSLLAGFSISVSPNPWFDPSPSVSGRDGVPFHACIANTVIRIESRLPGLLDSLGGMNIQVEYRLQEQILNTSWDGLAHASTRGHRDSIGLKAQRLFPNALELYVETPPARQLNALQALRYQWKVRAQFSLDMGTQTRYFPAPPVSDPLAYGPAYAKADFAQINRPFWADENTHRAKS